MSDGRRRQWVAVPVDISSDADVLAQNEEYGWEVISGDEKLSAQWEHTFVMTEHGVEILTH